MIPTMHRQRGTVVARTEPLKKLVIPCISRNRSLTGSASSGAPEEVPLGILWLSENLENPYKKQ